MRTAPCIPMSDASAPIDPFRHERFLPRVGDVFRVVVNDREELRMLLSEVALLVTDDRWDGRTRTPFSLLFHAPAETYAPQAVYRIECENGEIEPFEAFLVPIGPDRNGMRYEIIFT
jgi:hypothetical protein